MRKGSLLFDNTSAQPLEQIHTVGNGTRSIHVLERGRFNRRLSSQTISSKNIPLGNSNDLKKITGCGVFLHAMQMVSNCAKLIFGAWFNYSIISLHRVCNTTPPIGDMFIQGAVDSAQP